MQVCEKCGNQMDDKAVMCPACHSFITGYGEVPKPVDSGSIGWVFFGLIPSVLFTVWGLVLCVIWRTDRPKTAKRILIGLIIKIILLVVFLAIGFYWGKTTPSVPYDAGDWI